MCFVFRSFTLQLVLFALSGALLAPKSNALTIVTPTPERFSVQSLPPFVIAEKGIRHQLSPSFYSTQDALIIIIDGESQSPNYKYRVTLLDGPDGMTVTPDGVVEWVPGLAAVGDEFMCRYQIVVERDGVERYTALEEFGLRVVPELPSLVDRELVRYDGPSIGWSSMGFSGFDISYIRDLFRWSLIDPPPGVSIDRQGGVHWPGDYGYTGLTPYRVRVRVEYVTASGAVSTEGIYSRTVLPRPATVQFSDLRSLSISEAAYGMAGFSIAHSESWLVVGEPFPSFAWPGSGNPNFGRVRLWHRSASDESYRESYLLQPASGWPGQAFGASVALEEGVGERPARLAVGAPEARVASPTSSISYAANGYVYVFALDSDGTWREEARLVPPELRQGLYFGGWVDLSGETLVASMEGHASQGSKTGALAVFHYNSTSEEWLLSQVITAPDASWGDYFSYPSAIDGEWLAAAANEDDEDGINAGAVHLFRRTDGEFIHRQKLLSPEPEAGALFGERLHLKGPWLFVSAFRHRENRGAVYVFRELDGFWTYQQTLENPYVTPGSAFGMGLDRHGDILAVSAPGYLHGDPQIDGSAYPQKSLTLYRREGESWNFLRNVTGSPDSRPYPHTWGFALAQISDTQTIASIPDYRSATGFELAGRLFRHVWPEFIDDPFQDLLDELSALKGEPVLPGDDTDGNGIPNLGEWVMGQDPSSHNDTWGLSEPRASRAFIRKPAENGYLRYYLPRLRRGLGYRAEIEVSMNGSDWEVLTGLQWEPTEDVHFPQADGSRTVTYFSPVLIPYDESTRIFLLRLRLSPR